MSFDENDWDIASTDDATATEAKTVADTANTNATEAKTTADTANTNATEAKEAVESVTQHFWSDETGAHIRSESASSDGVQMNLDANSMDISDPNDQKVFFAGLMNDDTTGTVTFTSYVKNAAGTTKVSFPLTNLTIDSVDKNGTALTSGTDYTYDGTILTLTTALIATDVVTIVYTTSAYCPAFTSGLRPKKSSTEDYPMGAYSSVLGLGVAQGFAAHAEGGIYYDSSGAKYISTSNGFGSHSEGLGSHASNEGSHSEGVLTQSAGKGSHAEGLNTIANGIASHASGLQNTASGTGALAHGYLSETSGNYSSAFGRGLKNEGDICFIIGDYNSQTKHPFVIGIGTSDSKRVDGLDFDWSGNLKIAGDYGRKNAISSRTSAANPSAIVYALRMYGYDSNSDTIAGLETWENTSGNNVMSLFANKYDGDGTRTVQNYLRLYARKDGTSTIGVSNPDAWKNALNIQCAAITVIPSSAFTANQTYTEIPMLSILSECDPNEILSVGEYGIVCAKDGYVKVDVNGQFSGVAAGKYASIRVYDGTTNRLGNINAFNNGASAGYASYAGSSIIKVNAGDELILKGYVSGGTATITANANACKFTVQYIYC